MIEFVNSTYTPSALHKRFSGTAVFLKIKFGCLIKINRQSDDFYIPYLKEKYDDNQNYFLFFLVVTVFTIMFVLILINNIVWIYEA